MTFDEECKEIVDDILAVLKAKHHDYGEDNLQRHGLVGIVVRLSDKVARLDNIVFQKREQTVADETLRDTLIDIAGYAIQGIRMANRMVKN